MRIFQTSASSRCHIPTMRSLCITIVILLVLLASVDAKMRGRGGGRQRGRRGRKPTGNRGNPGKKGGRTPNRLDRKRDDGLEPLVTDEVIPIAKSPELDLPDADDEEDDGATCIVQCESQNTIAMVLCR